MNIEINYVDGHNPFDELFDAIPSIESEAEYKKLMIMEEILRLMEAEGVNRSQLAERMGVKPSRITAMMSGGNNFTIETLVRAGRALGHDLHQTFAPMGHQVKWNSYDPAVTHDAFIQDIRPQHVEKADVHFTLSETAPDDDKEAA